MLPEASIKGGGENSRAMRLHRLTVSGVWLSIRIIWAPAPSASRRSSSLSTSTSTFIPGGARRRAPPGMKVEVEVESEDDLREALGAGAQMILIDNQTPETVRRWSRIAREFSPPPLIEASGNMTLDRVRAYALAVERH